MTIGIPASSGVDTAGIAGRIVRVFTYEIYDPALLTAPIDSRSGGLSCRLDEQSRQKKEIPAKIGKLNKDINDFLIEVSSLHSFFNAIRSLIISPHWLEASLVVALKI